MNTYPLLPINCGAITLTVLVSTIDLIFPVSAQIRNPSQDFFEQGRERLEREIQQLQTNPENLAENQQKLPEPLLKVLPSPESSPNQKPNEIENPKQKPNDIKEGTGNG